MELKLSKKGWLQELKKMENIALSRARTVGCGRSYLYESGNGLTCIVKMRPTSLIKGYSTYWEINGHRISKKEIVNCLKRLHQQEN